MVYYNKVEKRCKRFWFPGCPTDQTNFNLFPNMKECQIRTVACNTGRQTLKLFLLVGQRQNVTSIKYDYRNRSNRAPEGCFFDWLQEGLNNLDSKITLLEEIKPFKNSMLVMEKRSFNALNIANSVKKWLCSRLQNSIVSL